MNQQNDQQTVTARVVGKKDTERGTQVELDILEFGSQYPTPVLVSSQIDNLALHPGLSYTVVLKRENLKKGKTGERPWDYYWGWVGFGPGSEGPVEPVAMSPSPEPVKAGKEWKMRDEDSIAQNTVLQTVGQIVASVASNRSDDAILLLCESLYKCLIDLRFSLPPTVRGTGVAVNPFAKVTTARSIVELQSRDDPQPGDGKGSHDSPVNVVDLLNRGLKLGYKSKTGMLAALGYKQESEITNIAAAWITLQELVNSRPQTLRTK